MPFDPYYFSDVLRRHLQVCAVDTLAAFVKPNLLSADERFLQPSSDLHSLDSVLELQWYRGVVQARRGELIRLLDEARLESTPVVAGYLAGDAGL